MRYIPKPVWAVGFALEQTLHVVALTVFSYVDFNVASAYKSYVKIYEAKYHKRKSNANISKSVVVLYRSRYGR
ncbi:MAG: hypothetical protein LBH59_01030 [Planctomycetaceae bacterium]|nr:hypothetical protein [Planctomycetaceae bacterium]